MLKEDRCFVSANIGRYENHLVFDYSSKSWNKTVLYDADDKAFQQHGVDMSWRTRRAWVLLQTPSHSEWINKVAPLGLYFSIPSL